MFLSFCDLREAASSVSIEERMESDTADILLLMTFPCWSFGCVLGFTPSSAGVLGDILEDVINKLIFVIWVGDVISQSGQGVFL